MGEIKFQSKKVKSEESSLINNRFYLNGFYANQ